jgi:hypothetical protein
METMFMVLVYWCGVCFGVAAAWSLWRWYEKRLERKYTAFRNTFRDLRGPYE